nr:hypothetical protein [Tanacetum cinerariifolium]
MKDGKDKRAFHGLETHLIRASVFAGNLIKTSHKTSSGMFPEPIFVILARFRIAIFLIFSPFARFHEPMFIMTIYLNAR